MKDFITAEDVSNHMDAYLNGDRSVTEKQRAENRYGEMAYHLANFLSPLAQARAQKVIDGAGEAYVALSAAYDELAQVNEAKDKRVAAGEALLEPAHRLIGAADKAWPYLNGGVKIQHLLPLVTKHLEETMDALKDALAAFEGTTW